MASGARSTKEILDDLCRDFDEPSQLAKELLAIVERIDLSRGIIAIATQLGPRSICAHSKRSISPVPSRFHSRSSW